MIWRAVALAVLGCVYSAVAEWTDTDREALAALYSSQTGMASRLESMSELQRQNTECAFVALGAIVAVSGCLGFGLRRL